MAQEIATKDVRQDIKTLEPEFVAALPPHVPVDRFMRVVLTAVNGNPSLGKADRRSLFEAAMKAAQDGLLPDGRDGALVVYRTKVRGPNGNDAWIEKVQWMPMVAGILKKVRNSGELQTISAHVVYSNDEFEYSLGDDENIVHRPAFGRDRGSPIAVYAIARTKDAGIYREVMSIAEIEKVRAVSRAKDSGPWRDWWDEMAKKTVIRRLSKRLPMSTDLDDLIRRDDDLYDFAGRRGEGAEPASRAFTPLADPFADDVVETKQIEPAGPTGDNEGEPAAGERGEEGRPLPALDRAGLLAFSAALMRAVSEATLAKIANSYIAEHEIERDGFTDAIYGRHLERVAGKIHLAEFSIADLLPA